MSFFVAGVYRSDLAYSAKGASTNTSCLVVGALSLALPTIVNSVPNVPAEDVLMLSRMSSCIVLVVYLLFLYFQFISHSHLFESENCEEEEEEADLSIISSLIVLVLTTVCVGICSEYLVQSIEGVTEEIGVPKAFIGVILLPIVGNAAEHSTAVTVAMKGKLDLCMGVAVGSSNQIALFV